MTECFAQLNENLQGDYSVLQQIASLRRENRFLKFGLIFCLVFSALPYLTGFQPDVIRARKVVTERVEFVRGGKTVASVTTHSLLPALVVLDEDGLGCAFLGEALGLRMLGVYDKDGGLVAMMREDLNGGSVHVLNKDGKTVVSMSTQPDGGSVIVLNKDEKPAAGVGTMPNGGAVSVHNKDGKSLH